MLKPSNKTTKKKRKKRELKRPPDMFQSCKVYTQMSGVLWAAKMINGLKETRGLEVVDSFKDGALKNFNLAFKETAF